jgi:hypothetical protein
MRPVPAPNIGSAASGPGTGGSTAPTTPDYASYITSDPGYQQALAASQAGDQNARALLQSQLNSALINFGGTGDFAAQARAMGMSPDQIAQLSGLINPETGSLASANKNSTLSMLSQAHDQAIQSLRASLAARGALESGATGVGVGLEDNHYQQGVSSAYSALMNALSGYGSGYANSVNTDAKDLSTAAGNAYATETALAQKDPGMFTPPPPPPTGNPVANASLVPPPGHATPQTISEHGAGQNAASLVTKASRSKKVMPNAYTTGRKEFG